MRIQSKPKQLILLTVLFAVAAALFYWIVHADWQYTRYTFESVNHTYTTDEMVEGSVLEQTMTVPMDYVDQIELDVNRWVEAPDKTLRVAITRDQQTLWEKDVPYSAIEVNGLTPIPIDPPVAMNGQPITLSVSAQGDLSIWYGNTRSAGRFVVAVKDDQPLTLNGQPLDGQAVVQIDGYNALHVMSYFWYIVLALYLLLLGMLITAWRKPRCAVNVLRETFHRYRYLLKQMISRDFRVKYRASVLGVLWSFLNPMLMTFVYYFVFSTIFRNSIDNFIVYLMSGIILFNYFSETSVVGLISVVNNANLITKVYIPKYIFPLSKSFSSAINLAISFFPLFVMMAITGVSFHKSLLLIPILLLFLIILAFRLRRIKGISLFFSLT